MRSPLDSGEWVDVEETPSTQDLARQALLDPNSRVGVIFARNQTAGRGRFDRPWFSAPGESLTMSLIFRAYANHPRPWLVAMGVAAAAAGAVHCRLRWPNDLYLDGKKLGGVLSELLPDESGRTIPVVGLGVNISTTDFPPEIASNATSLAMHRPALYDARVIAHQVLERLETIPEPTHFEDIQPIWTLFDDTPGKQYKLISGETAVAIGVGPEGELVCAVDGETTMVMAAEALA